MLRIDRTPLEADQAIGYRRMMAQLHTVIAEIDDDTLLIVNRVAQRRGISTRQFAAEAILRAAESDDDVDAFIQVGIDAIERGDVVPHEQVMAELEQMIEKHRARCG